MAIAYDVSDKPHLVHKFWVGNDGDLNIKTYCEIDTYYGIVFVRSDANLAICSECYEEFINNHKP